MTDWEKLERMAFVLGEIARGRCDNGRPLAAETSRQMARTVLDSAGLGWPYGRPASETMKAMISPADTYTTENAGAGASFHDADLSGKIDP